MDRGAWRAIVYGIAKKENMTEQLNNMFLKMKLNLLKNIPEKHKNVLCFCMSPSFKKRKAEDFTISYLMSKCLHR